MIEDKFFEIFKLLSSFRVLYQGFIPLQKYQANNKKSNNSSIQNSQEDVLIGTSLYVDLLNRTSWVSEFFYSEIRKEGNEEWRKHLLADHKVTKDNLHPKELVKQIIHHAYNYCVLLLHKHLAENAIKVSFTMDLWTAKNYYGFLEVTCLYIVQQFKLNEVILAIQHVRYLHTANNIYETVEKIIQYWNLIGKVHSITTDNALNIKKSVVKIDRVL
ncbi:16244_t:CDS:2 [Cetraspora pellucida]|uniref:16244_t:CDS:1 n=1 Tax=Cetraspora pellucida TaxID=1433469 RepID=A0A9N9FG83_9GLOM|nr:16244_t:CDS:2 [Cetraspora pellucida]